MMKAEAIGLYIHIPFCVRKCNYCDFCSFAISSFEQREKYIEVLCQEILTYKDKGLTLDTVFFGGGTPSLLTGEEIEKIFTAIKNAFHICSDAEVTMEVNPKTLTRENLLAYISAGVNRFSVGLQSIHENELKILGRIHNYADFLDSYNLLRECGVKNISVDVMYGIPEQTTESFRKTLSEVIALSPEHVSLYSLIFEEGTRFWDMRESFVLPTEDEEMDMYETAISALRSAGYSHYEISNYALSGYECRHNLKYWRDEEYIGVGLAAHSCFEGFRFSNTTIPEEYLADFRSYRSDPVPEDKKYEYVMLRLRLAEGIDLCDYRRRFSEDLLCGKERVVDEIVKNGYAILDFDRLRLTDKGLYISNWIITELI